MYIVFSLWERLSWSGACWDADSTKLNIRAIGSSITSDGGELLGFVSRGPQRLQNSWVRSEGAWFSGSGGLWRLRV